MVVARNLRAIGVAACPKWAFCHCVLSSMPRTFCWFTFRILEPEFSKAGLLAGTAAAYGVEIFFGAIRRMGDKFDSVAKPASA